MRISSFQESSGLQTVAFLLLPLGRVSATSYHYVLETAYTGASFFDGFSFFTDTDPTHGFVNYVDQATAQFYNFISSGDDVPAYIGVDYSTHIYPNMTQGRASVRVESKNTFTHGLFISDIEHMPGGICGTWPAHWTLGSNWPTNGEIDIIEGVNSGLAQLNKNLMSLHTSPGCTIAGANETGSLQSNNCDTTVNYNSGCGVLSDTTKSYGNDFNGGNGGVYATEWTSEYIRIWFFQRGSVPLDITNGMPDPAQWGPPQANFEGSCSIDDKFADHKIIFDTTFCGDYAGTVWSSDTICSSLALTCDEYVAQHPEAFSNAFWSVNSVKVYQQAPLLPTSEAPLLPTSEAPLLPTSEAPLLPTSEAPLLPTSEAPLLPTSAASLPFTVPQASVIAPGMRYSNSSRTSAGSSPTTNVVPNLGAFKYIGCAASSSGFVSFTEVGYSVEMTLETCTSECGAASYEYAGVVTTHCYCSNSLSSDITVTPGQGSCTKLCPGNLREFCGGEMLGKRNIERRQVDPGVLLSLYASNALALTSAVPQNAVPGYGMGGGASIMTSTIISTTYVDVCDICENGYRTIATVATIKHCGCMDVAPLPTIHMTTMTKLCSSCGEGGSPAVATVTIPCALDTYVAPVIAVSLGIGALNVTWVRNGSTRTTTGESVKFTGEALTMNVTGIRKPVKFISEASAIEINAGVAIAGILLLAII